MASEDSIELTLEQLFNEFRKAESGGETVAYDNIALAKFREVKDKACFLEPAKKFFMNEKDDHINSWAASISLTP